MSVWSVKKMTKYFKYDNMHSIPKSNIKTQPSGHFTALYCYQHLCQGCWIILLPQWILTKTSSLWDKMEEIVFTTCVLKHFFWSFIIGFPPKCSISHSSKRILYVLIQIWDAMHRISQCILKTLKNKFDFTVTRGPPNFPNSSEGAPHL